MISLLKNKIILVLLIIIAILVILSIGYSIHIKNLKVQRDMYQNNTMILERSNQIFVDKMGDSVKIIGQLRYKIKEFQDTKNSWMLEYTRAMGIKDKKIKELLFSNTYSHTTGIIRFYDTVYVDTNGTKNIIKTSTWSDIWMTIKANMKNDSIMIFDYTRKDTLICAKKLYKLGKWKFKNIFWPRPWEAEFYVKSTCPYQSIILTPVSFDEFSPQK